MNKSLPNKLFLINFLILFVKLFRFLRFETKMQEMCVQWRDIQIQIDEFHDHRLEVKQKLRQQKPPAQKSDALNKWEFYKIQEETTKQVSKYTENRFYLIFFNGLPHWLLIWASLFKLDFSKNSKYCIFF